MENEMTTKKTAAANAAEQIEAAVAAGKDNMDALVKSGAMLAKGAQDFNALWFDFAQASTEDGIAATKAILGCKTLQQVAEVQGDLVKGGYDKLVTESRKMSDMSVKVAENAAKPIAGRVNVAVEKFTKPLAT
jgi:phasin family protein